MKRILCQGDSITDFLRADESQNYMGSGYVTMLAGKIALAHPGKYEVVNRGISGNRVVDLYARIKKDVINLKPDILTVLIGVNDVGHEIAHQNGVDTKKYEKILSMFVEEVKEALPDIKIILMEPFVLEGKDTSEHMEQFAPMVAANAQACRRVAEKYGLGFVPLQEKMEAFAAKTSPAYVLFDGVHPAPAGHAIITEALFEELNKFL